MARLRYPLTNAAAEQQAYQKTPIRLSRGGTDYEHTPCAACSTHHWRRQYHDRNNRRDYFHKSSIRFGHLIPAARCPGPVLTAPQNRHRGTMIPRNLDELERYSRPGWSSKAHSSQRSSILIPSLNTRLYLLACHTHITFGLNTQYSKRNSHIKLIFEKLP